MKVNFFQIGDKFSSEEEEAIMLSKVKSLIPTITNFEKLYKESEEFFISIEGDKIDWAFMDRDYENTNVEEGGHETIFVTSYAGIVIESSSQEFGELLEEIGIEEETCMGILENYLQEGDEIQKYRIEI